MLAQGEIGDFDSPVLIQKALKGISAIRSHNYTPLHVIKQVCPLIGTHHDALAFQIAVQDFLFMKVAHRIRQLLGHPEYHVLGKSADSTLALNCFLARVYLLPALGLGFTDLTTRW